MADWNGKPRAGEKFFGTIVVEPSLARLETRDDRVTRSGEVFGGMLVWRTVTAADVTALRAPAKMKPPSAPRQAFGAACSAWLGRWIDTFPQMLHASCRLAVRDARLALPNLYNIAIRIANVAARLAVLVLWLRDKLGPSTSP